jgi:hypothetical protein
MFPVERGVGTGTACLCGVIRRIEPKAEVIELHGIDLHGGCCLRDEGGRARKYVRRGRRWDTVRKNESLDIEPADEIADTGASVIGVNIADIPGEPERRLWNLNREQVEVGVRRQTMNDDFKIFKCAEGMISDRGGGIMASSRSKRNGSCRRAQSQEMSLGTRKLVLSR